MTTIPHILHCPSCLSPLPLAVGAAATLDCDGCGARYPVRFGIPDLRPDGVEDPYLTRDDDLRSADRLASRAEQGGFEAALAAYYETNARVPASQARRFITGALAAEERAGATWQAWQESSGTAAAGLVVDVGCGTGPLLAAAQSPNVQLIGVDVGLRWLVLARARLRERQAVALLACAGATRLPLASQAVDMVASEALLENVVPASAVIEESARVLRAGGWCCLTTANRWSLGPDPHVGLPLGGWLPDAVVARWAERRGMVPPRRRLLSAADLRRLLGGPDFTDLRIAPPSITDAQRNGASPLIRAAVDVYRAVGRLASGRAVLRAAGPSLLAVARRAAVPNDPARRPSTAPRP
ncbi:MAG TPA: class I SAM-dependent methyltransferase [Gemmatimonadaceae bacterium]